ncbi:uncharacterized protein LOC132050707 [Lycium ferocissimum]|uniref:uncharacterized protein LOC132050707 n=1 Tax=Lycium ferocissimum TaxID=112874 RepID=UPI0028156191|nr:uncharacterized protein LOC132050707 [Lycium ferocissimum]
MANFEHNVMVALYWGGEIITEMNGFRYTEGAKMIVSMFISTNYAELVELLHEKMGTNSENIQIDISGKYPCSFQEPIIQPSFQQLPMHDNPNFYNQSHTNVPSYSATHGFRQSFGAGPSTHDHRSFDEGSSSQRRTSSSHGEYEAREAEASVDMYNDANAEISSENSEDDDPSGEDEESERESEPDEYIGDSGDLLQNNIGVNPHNQFGHGVSEIPCHDIPYFTTLENEEDIFISTRESEMGCCLAWSEDANKDLEKNMYFSSKAKLKRAVTIWSLRKNKEFEVVTSNKSLWVVRCRFYKTSMSMHHSFKKEKDVASISQVVIYHLSNSSPETKLKNH